MVDDAVCLIIICVVILIGQRGRTRDRDKREVLLLLLLLRLKIRGRSRVRGADRRFSRYHYTLRRFDVGPMRRRIQSRRGGRRTIFIWIFRIVRRTQNNDGRRNWFDYRFRGRGQNLKMRSQQVMRGRGGHRGLRRAVIVGCGNRRRPVVVLRLRVIRRVDDGGRRPGHRERGRRSVTGGFRIALDRAPGVQGGR